MAVARGYPKFGADERTISMFYMFLGAVIRLWTECIVNDIFWGVATYLIWP